MAVDITDDLFDAIYRVNVLGTIHTNQSAYRIMKEARTGAIVNFGSMSGFTGELSNATYGSSKGAVHTWTRTVAREWGPSGVRVNAVLPYMNTPMFDKYTNSLSPDELAVYREELKKTFLSVERSATPSATWRPSWSSWQAMLPTSSPVSCCRSTAVSRRFADPGAEPWRPRHTTKRQNNALTCIDTARATT
jgi:NAD(P)-dependent dehydrogenase (short-subunit alcohol dehydrogenase family)